MKSKGKAPRCRKCGGWTHPYRVQRSHRTEIWEWTCITCGRTTYQDVRRESITPGSPPP